MPADGGIRFGPYVLLRRIARGGMAEVFLAQQRGLEGFDRRVAVKRILPHLNDTPDFVKMFLGEARLAAQLTHPNIVHIYDFGKVDQDYFIAMEYVEGVHAGEVFKAGEKQAKLSPTLVARIGADAAAALNYAHELVGVNGKPLGLVHRDVSPANIMISYDGIVKLCDFGIAKAMAASDQLTNPGQVKGKYAYMSPEQTIASPLDGRSDVFALAIVLWELLVGRTAVPRGDAVDAMRMIRDGKLQPIEKAAPGTPPALAKAITWGLETKRDRRATAADLAQALEAFIKASPELATPMQLAQWVRGRFPRDASGAQPMPGARGPGTNIAPGTNVAPGTVGGSVSRGLGSITPSSNLIAASRISEPPADETAETVALLSSSDLSGVTSDERDNAAVLDELARDLHSQRETVARPAAMQTLLERGDVTLIDPSIRAAEEATLRDRGHRAAEESTLRDGAHGVFGDSSETALASGAFRQPVPSGPTVVPTRVQYGIPATTQHRSMTPVPDPTVVTMRRVKRFVVPAVALVGLAIFSFLIALAARGCGGGSSNTPVVAPAPDAAAIVVIDAPPKVVDAAVKVVDAAADSDAWPALVTDGGAREPTALLSLRTTPNGATLKVGDQVRTAPADFAVPDGTHQIVAELEGFLPEKREVSLIRDERVVLEIVFTRRVPAPGRADKPKGTLVVATNPYSDVFDGSKALGQTPFELDMPVGTYTLTFKNPNRPPTTRTVKILAGKPTRLRFDLPK